MSTLSKEQLQKISLAYDSEPWWYDIRGFFILTMSYRVSLLNQIRFFAQNISDNHLEVAIGSGSLFSIILTYRTLNKGRPKHIVAFDYAESMLAGAIKKFANQPAIHLSVADVTHLDFADRQFDSISVANAIHCFADIDTALKELNRILKPNGTFACNVLLHPRGPRPLRWIANQINRWGIKKGILVTPYSADEFLTRLQAAGFHIKMREISGNSMNIVASKEINDRDIRLN